MYFEAEPCHFDPNRRCRTPFLAAENVFLLNLNDKKVNHFFLGGICGVFGRIYLYPRSFTLLLG